MEIGTEAAQFPEKEYINGIFDAVQPFQFQATDLTRCILIGRFFWGKGGDRPESAGRVCTKKSLGTFERHMYFLDHKKFREIGKMVMIVVCVYVCKAVGY